MLDPARTAEIADPGERARTAHRLIKEHSHAWKHRAAIAELHRIRREALEELQATGMTHRQIAKVLGLSAPRVTQLLNLKRDREEVATLDPARSAEIEALQERARTAHAFIKEHRHSREHRDAAAQMNRIRRETLKELRAAGLSHRDLAELLGVAAQQVAEYLRLTWVGEDVSDLAPPSEEIAVLQERALAAHRRIKEHGPFGEHRDAVAELTRIRREALEELRSAGLTYRELAELLGVSAGRAQHLVRGRGQPGRPARWTWNPAEPGSE